MMDTPIPNEMRAGIFVVTFIKGFIVWFLVVMTWAAIFNSQGILKAALIGGGIVGTIRGLISYNAPSFESMKGLGMMISGAALLLWVIAIPVWIIKLIA
jgi:hypothetical protein